MEIEIQDYNYQLNYFFSFKQLLYFFYFVQHFLIKLIFMKRNYLLIILTAALTLTIGNVFSQTRSENHEALSSHHKIARDHANAIVQGKSKTVEEHRKHANDASENLEMAKKAHENLKGTIKPEEKEKVRTHNEAIEKYHNEATKHVSDLKEELNKPKPDVSKAKSHAKMFSTSIENAEKEHQAIKQKLAPRANKKP